MTPLRIAFDMDGTLADLAAAYAVVEESLFPQELSEHQRPAPESREREQHAAEGAEPPATIGDNREAVDRRSFRRSSERRDRIWRVIEETPDFWTTLKPLENGAVKRLYELTCRHNWEVFFITQRPATAGATVQLQSQRWLMEHGFSTPSVIPLSGGRGRCAAALHLDYLIDDTPQNCVDVLSDSATRAILLVAEDDSIAESSARRIGIGTAHNIHEVLDLLVQATEARVNPSLFEKLRKLVGWK
jgi:5'(3')-deoxyribonucleotidase